MLTQSHNIKEMDVFLSTYYQKLDEKYRVSVPAAFRRLLENETLIVYRSYKEESVLECVSLSRMSALSNSIDTLDPFDNSTDDITASIFADAISLKIADDGRVTLSGDLVSYCNFKNQVAFVGRGATFQIWEPEKFKQYQQDAHTRIRKIMIAQQEANAKTRNKQSEVL